MEFPDLDPRKELSYEIWGTVIASSVFICGAEIKIDEDNNRIYVAVEFIKLGQLLRKFHPAWLVRVEENIKKLIPVGYRVTAYVVVK